MTDTSDTAVIDNQAKSRLEFRTEGQLAELVYHVSGTRLILIHTGVPDALGGRGIAGKLVRAALDKATASGMTIVPLCPYARSWLERNPDEAARVPIDWSRPTGS
jgi:predicted GNAT family acetyltransferase